MKKLKVIDIVDGTASNESGYALFIQLDKFFAKGEKVQLSLEGCNPMSSSFMNSSFGELMEKYGFSKIKKNLSFIHFTKTQINTIKEYFDCINETA